MTIKLTDRFLFKFKTSYYPWIVSVLIMAVLSSFVIFIPLYNDELYFKMVNSRLFIDNFRIVNWLPQCELKTETTIPWFFYFNYLVNSTLYYFMSSPIFIRVVGILVFIAIFFGTYLFSNQVQGNNKNKNLSYFFSSLFLVGALPWLLSMGRPEQTQMLGTIVLLIILYTKYSERFKALVFILISTFIMADHPKALFLSFFLYPAGWFLFSDSKIKIFCLTILTYLFGASYIHYSQVSCTQAPLMNTMLSNVAIKPKELLGWSYIEFKNKFVTSIQYFSYIKNLHIQTEFQSNWLPVNMDLSRYDRKYNEIIDLLFKFINSFVIVGIFYNLFAFLRFKTHKKSLFLSIGLIATFFVSIFLFRSTNFYESSFRIPLILWIFLLTTTHFSLWAHPLVRKYVLPLLTFAVIISQIYFTTRIIGHWTRNEDNSQAKDHITSLINECDLQSRSRVITDRHTLPYIWKKVQLPIDIGSIYGSFGQDIKDIRVFFNQLKIEGIITKCENFPKEYITDVKQSSGYCCLKLNL